MYFKSFCLQVFLENLKLIFTSDGVPESHKMVQIMDDVENNLDKLSDELKERFRKLVVFQINLLKYKNNDPRNFDVKLNNIKLEKLPQQKQPDVKTLSLGQTQHSEVNKLLSKYKTNELTKNRNIVENAKVDMNMELMELNKLSSENSFLKERQTFKEVKHKNDHTLAGANTFQNLVGEQDVSSSTNRSTLQGSGSFQHDSMREYTDAGFRSFTMSESSFGRKLTPNASIRSSLHTRGEKIKVNEVERSLKTVAFSEHNDYTNSDSVKSRLPTRSPVNEKLENPVQDMKQYRELHSPIPDNDHVPSNIPQDPYNNKPVTLKLNEDRNGQSDTFTRPSIIRRDTLKYCNRPEDIPIRHATTRDGENHNESFRLGSGTSALSNLARQASIKTSASKRRDEYTHLDGNLSKTNKTFGQTQKPSKSEYIKPMYRHIEPSETILDDSGFVSPGRQTLNYNDLFVNNKLKSTKGSTVVENDVFKSDRTIQTAADFDATTNHQQIRQHHWTGTNTDFDVNKESQMKTVECSNVETRETQAELGKTYNYSCREDKPLTVECNTQITSPTCKQLENCVVTTTIKVSSDDSQSVDPHVVSENISRVDKEDTKGYARDISHGFSNIKLDKSETGDTSKTVSNDRHYAYCDMPAIVRSSDPQPSPNQNLKDQGITASSRREFPESKRMSPRVDLSPVIGTKVNPRYLDNNEKAFKEEWQSSSIGQTVIDRRQPIPDMSSNADRHSLLSASLETRSNKEQGVKPSKPNEPVLLRSPRTYGRLSPLDLSRKEYPINQDKVGGNIQPLPEERSIRSGTLPPLDLSYKPINYVKQPVHQENRAGDTPKHISDLQSTAVSQDSAFTGERHNFEPEGIIQKSIDIPKRTTIPNTTYYLERTDRQPISTINPRSRSGHEEDYYWDPRTKTSDRLSRNAALDESDNRYEDSVQWEKGNEMQAQRSRLDRHTISETLKTNEGKHYPPGNRANRVHGSHFIEGHEQDDRQENNEDSREITMSHIDGYQDAKLIFGRPQRNTDEDRSTSADVVIDKDSSYLNAFGKTLLAKNTDSENDMIEDDTKESSMTILDRTLSPDSRSHLNGERTQGTGRGTSPAKRVRYYTKQNDGDIRNSYAGSPLVATGGEASIFSRQLETLNSAVRQVKELITRIEPLVGSLKEWQGSYLHTHRLSVLYLKALM